MNFKHASENCLSDNIFKTLFSLGDVVAQEAAFQACLMHNQIGGLYTNREQHLQYIIMINQAALAARKVHMRLCSF